MPSFRSLYVRSTPKPVNSIVSRGVRVMRSDRGRFDLGRFAAIRGRIPSITAGPPNLPDSLYFSRKFCEFLFLPAHGAVQNP